MPLNKRYTRQEKLELLAAYADALANNPDYIEVWLEVMGLDAERLATWRAQLEAGQLAGDETELPASVGADGSIAALANLYRAHITQVKPGAHTVLVDSTAGLVIYDAEGNWRLDYLARARSALKAVITAAEAEPERFLRPNAVPSATHVGEEGQGEILPSPALTPAEAVAEVRAAWGVDRFPSIERPPLAGAGDEWDARRAAAKARDAVDKRMSRWTKQLAGNPRAIEALMDWYRAQEPSPIPLPAHRLPAAPTWAKADPNEWPPDGEGRWLDGIAEYLLGEALPLARFGDDRQRMIVMRRTVETISDYIRDNRQLAGVKIYYQHHVVRPWQGYSMEDLRTPEERSGAVKSSTTDRPIVAAIAAMCLHTVLREWDPRAAEATMKRTLDMFQAFSPTRPEANHRQRAVAHRMQQAQLPRLQQVAKPNHPEFIRNVSPNVTRLFYVGDLLRMGPGPVTAGWYIDARRAIVPSDLSRGNGRRVVQLADYAANLAVAAPAVRKTLRSGQVQELRAALLKSTKGDPLEAAWQRNEALAMQRRSYDGAITEGIRGRGVLQKQRSNGEKVNRDQLIMEEQLCMNLAGSAVQWLEYMLGGDPEWQKEIPVEQWKSLTNFALHESNRAVEIIEQLHGSGELATQRYSDGFLADDNFVYRAWDILYRCTCAAATAAKAFGFDNRLTHHDFTHELNEAHLAITTIDKPISTQELPRLLHSMLWHTFLTGGILPALKYDTLNGSLVDKDALTRVLTPEELADPDCRTVMTYTRIALLTDWLIQCRWTAGAMGLIQPHSRVWHVLEERSGGLYGVWREDFGSLLTTTHEEPAATPPRDRYSFHQHIEYPGAAPRSESDSRPRRPDWSGERDGLIPPAYSTDRSSSTDERSDTD